MEPRRMQPQLRRLNEAGRRAISLTIDGERVSALEGDTILTAVLLHGRTLRSFEFGSERRAGFCLMGACQDCWVRDGEGATMRACTTFVTPDMCIETREMADEA